MNYVAGNADVLIIGGGHAGCEAALASARTGNKTIMFAISLDSIALMPCNPNIGGTSKGHLVREIDALGGEMGLNIDKSFIQSRMLNLSKGPAVHSLRAQADKKKYTLEMKKVLENTDNLKICEQEIVDIIVENNIVKGVITNSGAIYYGKAVVICTGTYLKSRCLYGDVIINSGPNGLKNSVQLSDSLKKLDIKMFTFKTGTPARIDKRYIDFSKMEIQNGDEKIVPFSFLNKAKDLQREQIPCYLGYTNLETHEIINKNINRSPMYSGVIEGTGTRYCPSIEDKIVRFADKDRHQIFIEPEGETTNEMYVQGMSTSMPEDVQIEMYRTIKGLENCQFMRTGYAIEYNCIDATALKLSLEFRNIKGLFSAGQFNGSSGYEEAAAQGLVAGINAGRFIKEEEPLTIDRSEGYIGVLIDDLVTKGTKEPYRMMTSRAEYRLLLRQDNADLRLTEKGYNVNLVTENRWQIFTKKRKEVNEEIERIKKVTVSKNDISNNLITSFNTTPIEQGVRLSELIKRPELTYENLAPLDLERKELGEDVKEQVNIQIKYEGYINKQKMQVIQFKKLENKKIPFEINFFDIKGLRNEAKQKLDNIRPENIGHASRITGVSPSDISVLLVYLETYKSKLKNKNTILE